MPINKKDILTAGYINRICNGFIKQVFPDVPDEQAKDIRRVFFAGAMTVFNGLTNVEDDATDEEMMCAMSLMQDEFEAFGYEARARVNEEKN